MRRTSLVASLIALALTAPAAEARPVFGPAWSESSVRTIDPGWDWESVGFGAGVGVGLSALAALGVSAVRPRPR
jgi:hypothetical protein